MDALKVAFLEIRSVRDCESVRNLLVDCWLIALERGEDEGLKFAAAVYRRGIEEYERQRVALALFGRWKGESECAPS